MLYIFLFAAGFTAGALLRLLIQRPKLENAADLILLIPILQAYRDENDRLLSLLLGWLVSAACVAIIRKRDR
jgi:hypothetical protein